MSTTIIKPDPNQDWYCVWESIVDNWIYAGTRAELEAACPQYAEGERFDRADATGSSALWGDGEPIYSWASEDRTLTVRNFAGELSDALSDRMEDAISEALGGRIVTRWVLVAEAIEDDGEPSVHSLTSPGLPLWQRYGLLQWDAQSWVPQPLWTTVDDEGVDE